MEEGVGPEDSEHEPEQDSHDDDSVFHNLLSPNKLDLPKRFAASFAIRSPVISLMLSENLRETPDFVERIVKGSRGDADDVRFAEIAFDAYRLEFGEQFFRMFVD